MDHINQLIEKLESAAEELKAEYFRLWDEDTKRMVSYAILRKYKNNPV